jgi:hypothetical protein
MQGKPYGHTDLGVSACVTPPGGPASRGIKLGHEGWELVFPFERVPDEICFYFKGPLP